MKGHRGARFSLPVLLAIVLALGAGLLAAPQASAQQETLKVDSVTVAPGEQVPVNVRALDIAAPGLGAWEIGIVYNPSVVSVVFCSAAGGSVCNANFASNQVRITGASASGHLNDTTLAIITFRCNSQGTSTLATSAIEFADATVGSPQPIGAAVQNGQVTCSSVSPPGPGQTPGGPTSVNGVQATATPIVNGLPSSGTGGSPGGGIPGWLIAVLASAGLTTIAGTAALRARAARA